MLTHTHTESHTRSHTKHADRESRKTGQERKKGRRQKKGSFGKLATKTLGWMIYRGVMCRWVCLYAFFLRCFISGGTRTKRNVHPAGVGAAVNRDSSLVRVLFLSPEQVLRPVRTIQQTGSALGGVWKTNPPSQHRPETVARRKVCPEVLHKSWNNADR